MKVKLKKVYYCDFCKKKGLRIDRLRSHELSCTMNPNRICGLCGFRGLKSKALDDPLDCPICHFSRLRQTEWKETSFYDLNKAMQEYWSNQDQPNRY